jgi:hypothetical protein
MIRSRRMRLVGHVMSMGKMKYAKKIMARKPGGKICLGRWWCGLVSSRSADIPVAG